MHLVKACLILLLITTHFTQAQTQPIKACIDDHPPYQILEPTPSGIHIHALRVLANILDKEIIFVKSPNFARCVAFLKSGEVDVIAGLSPTTPRKQFAFFTPFKRADQLRVISKKQIKVTKYEDLYGKIIGVARGESYFPRFDKDTSLDKISIQNARVGFSLLLKDRIDILMVSPEKFASLSKEQDLSALWISPITLDKTRAKETSFGFSKKHNLNMSNAELIRIVDKAYKAGVFKPVY
ncbi:substrate-binding periplasmic protein [Pseudoalteromonas phenolica]|uniref:Solute-binding protein family 3/N-terminal domain-containing protein n=1 Tax=Pseudoalteromonas phenolica TaxID=161398 RepID=A0A0S2JYR8_9GAMM|nr:transporter substrate-binding domain-containing protein [Pseudoalteromonas phenolica]ALO41169.1 hypothetical protein PP2015_649 [Pseudoalteromonas phenolica]